MMKLRAPNWLRRRRRFWAGHYSSDREACHGADGLESAVNWMQYILGRDFDGRAVNRCVIVAEVGEGQEAATVYATHSVDATPVEVRGLLHEGIRAQDEGVARMRRHSDIQQFVSAAVPQLLDALRGPASEAVRLQQADGLVRMQMDCLKAASAATDEAERNAFLEASRWAERRFEEIEPEDWRAAYEAWVLERREDGAEPAQPGDEMADRSPDARSEKT